MAIRSKIGMQSTESDAKAPAATADHYRWDTVHAVRETAPARTTERHAQGRELANEMTPLPQSWSFGVVIRIVFGAIWATDAYFKWQPPFLGGLLDVMHDGSAGQPGWLMPWFDFTHAIIAFQPTLWAYLIALIETGIALALIFGVARKLTYLGGAVWSLLIWTTAEGFGRMSSGVATDIGTGIIYTMVFLALLAADRCQGTRPYSLDAVIERRLPWWHRIAEGRR